MKSGGGGNWSGMGDSQLSPGVCVAMATLNEAACLEACLKSVQWADEIVIVDDGSTDGTVEIARRFTDKVTIAPSHGNFHANKNLAIQTATRQWVLSLDADEVIPAELADEIRHAIQGTSYAAFRLGRRNHFLGRWIRHGGWSPDYTIRLFDKRKGRFTEREVHEVVRLEGSAATLKHPIEHYTYRSLAAYQERVGRYAALAAREMRKKGRRFHAWDPVAHPLWTMFRMYFLRQGFRDGIDGLLLAGLYGYYTFLKYAKLWEMELQDRAPDVGERGR